MPERSARSCGPYRKRWFERGIAAMRSAALLADDFAQTLRQRLPIADGTDVARPAPADEAAV